MPAMRALSCSVLLTDNNANNGPLMLVPGSHRQFISCVGQTPNEHYKQSLRSRSTACRIRSACSCWWSRAASRP